MSFTLWLLILFLTTAYSAALTNTTCESGLSFSEFNALMALFESTGGAKWIWNLALPQSTRWSFPNNCSAPCIDHWQGLTCSSSARASGNCTISSMELSKSNLHGPLPTEIGDLTGLQILDLSGNRIQESLPSELGRLTNLTSLELSGNNISKTIPTEFGSLSLLGTLGLKVNRLSGQIPLELANLKSLFFLDMDDNDLSGPIPNEFGNMSVAFLSLQYNLLTGSLRSSLCNATNLSSLFLRGSSLSGSIPECFGFSLKQLQQLGLGANNLTGTIPRWGKLGNLNLLDVEANSLSGTLPTTLGNLLELQQLRFSKNFLIGTVPTEIGGLRGLNSLQLSHNRLSGRLPELIGDLTQLDEIFLDYNSFSGMLPELGNCISLQKLYVAVNSLTGTIPDAVASLPQLQYLDLEQNSLSGPIPSSFGKNMVQINLFQNSLTGAIPPQIVSYPLLVSIDIHDNLLTGIIPPEIFQNPGLEVLVVYDNSLTGSIPSTLAEANILEVNFNSNHLTGSLPDQLPDTLESFYANENSLEGSIPESLGRIKNLAYFGAFNNQLSGSLPPSFGNTSGNLLFEFDVGINSLTGTIASHNFGNLVRLELLYLDHNSFTGIIPSTIGLLTELLLVWVENNLFSGSIPSEISLLEDLGQFNAKANLFTGTFPIGVAKLTSLSQLAFADNHLSGNFGSSYTNLRALELLNASINHFTGNLLEIFPDDSLHNFPLLDSLDFSVNEFSGTVPAALFTCTSLVSLSLYGNCFSGSIPETICQSSVVETLILGSLTTGDGCLVELPPLMSRVAKGVFPIRSLQGSIPDCVWKLPSLRNLHLSGNGLGGPLGEIPITSNLTALSVSHNKITGTIPMSIQTSGKFSSIDLFNNKLSGTLSSGFVVNSDTSLDLAVNRLSGIVPDTVLGLQNVDILTGNLFTCPDSSFVSQSSGLPSNDPATATYGCGSLTLNASMLVWAVMICVALAIAAAIFKSNTIEDVDRNYFVCFMRGVPWRSETRRVIQKWWKESTTVSSAMESSVRFLEINRLAAKAFAAIVSFHLVVALTLYLILKFVPSLNSVYSTHQFQYGWMPTCVYLHGDLPSALVMIFYFTTIVIYALFLATGSARSSGVERKLLSSVSSSLVVKNIATKVFQLSAATLVQVINALVSLLVNIGYVRAAIRGNYSPSVLLVIQGVMSIYKLTWCSVYIPWAISLLSFLPARSRMRHEVFIYVVNFIFAPCLATLFTDSNCLYYAVEGQASIQSTYPIASTFLNCQLTVLNFFTLEIANASNYHLFSRCNPFGYTDDVTISYTPPWYYSYQCGSAVLINYVPVLFYVYAISGVLVPAIKFLLVLNPLTTARYVPVVCAELFLGGKIFYLRSSESEIGATNKLPSVWSLLATPPNRLFRGSNVIARRLLDFAMLSTFGVAAPILSIAITVHMAVNMSLWRLLIGRFLVGLDTAEGTARRFALQLLENSMNTSSKGIVSSIWLIVMVTALFWSLMVFDMITDVYGTTAGVIALSLCFGVPTVAFPIIVLFARSNKTLWTAGGVNGVIDERELESPESRSSNISDAPDLPTRPISIELTEGTIQGDVSIQNPVFHLFRSGTGNGNGLSDANDLTHDQH